MAINMTWSVDRPIVYILVLETAFVANELFYFAVLIGTGGNSQYIISFRPEYNFSGTFGTRPMRVLRIGKPYPAFKAESLISQCAHRANIDHIAGEVVVDGLLYVSTDF